MRTFIVLCLLCSLPALVGCAAGGGAATGSEQQSSTSSDERGFEKSVGPAEIQYQSAQQFLSAGNFDEAISHLKNAVAIRPDYLAAWADLGATLTKIKDFQGGIDAYEKALLIEPNSIPLTQAIAYNYLYLEKWDKAQQYYERVAEKDSLSYDANVHLGFIHQKRRSTDMAIMYYERALAAQPLDATTLGTLAGLYEKQGDEAKKIDYLKRAAEAAPDNYKFQEQLGSAYMKKKDFVNAAAVFETLAKNKPDEAAYHQNLGLALSQIPERKKEAPAELEKALELKGDNGYVAGLLAQIYNDDKQYEKAIASVKRGLNNPSGQEALLHWQWGRALSKLGSYDEAIVQFEQVIATAEPQWMEPAKKEIARQESLKKRQKAIEEQNQ